MYIHVYGSTSLLYCTVPTQADLARAKPVSATPQTSSTSTTSASPPPPSSSAAASKPVLPDKPVLSAKPVTAPVAAQRKKNSSSKDEEVLRKVQELQKKKAELQQKQKEQQSKVSSTGQRSVVQLQQVSRHNSNVALKVHVYMYYGIMYQCIILF